MSLGVEDPITRDTSGSGGGVEEKEKEEEEEEEEEEKDKVVFQRFIVFKFTTPHTQLFTITKRNKNIQ